MYCEELGLPYKSIFIEMNDSENGVKGPAFLKLNPNGRVPAIVDPNNNNFVVWESMAILVYIAQMYDTKKSFYGRTIEEQATVNQWVAFQISGIGPTQGQINWFKRRDPNPTKNDRAIERYTNEALRLYRVLDRQLEEQNGTICLNKVTIADFAFLSWAKVSPVAELDLTKFKHVHAWYENMHKRPAIAKALDDRTKAIAAAT